MNQVSFQGLANMVTVNKQTQQVKEQSEPVKTNLQEDNALLEQFSNLKLLMEPQPQSDEVHIKYSNGNIDAMLGIDKDLNLVIKEKVDETADEITYKQTILDSNEFPTNRPKKGEKIGLGELKKLKTKEGAQEIQDKLTQIDPEAMEKSARRVSIESLKLDIVQAKGENPLGYLGKVIFKSVGDSMSKLNPFKH